MLISYLTAPPSESRAQIQLPDMGLRSLVNPKGPAAVDHARDVPTAGIVPKAPPADKVLKAGQKAVECNIPPADKPWLSGLHEFSAPHAAPDTFSGRTVWEGPAQPCPGFLVKAVGHIYEAETLKFWKENFDKDVYVENILRSIYNRPVQMMPEEAKTTYRERNNNSARQEMDFVRHEVDRLVEAGQVIEVAEAMRCTNPLSVAFKINGDDGSIKKRLVINLSRWVNGFIKPDSYKMARFQDALAQSSPRAFQSVYDVTKAYHHIRLHRDWYQWEGFCSRTRTEKNTSTTTS
jgi:hypothetical protein